ncbi:ATPase [Colletotrichum higginsianum]|nr:ATPase [Colletotrichum higginsianum]
MMLPSHAEPPAPVPNDTAGAEGGSECAMQTLYEGKRRCECCRNWVEEYPKDLQVKVEARPAVKQKALVARMRRNHDGGEGDGEPLALDSLVVQSASLKRTLGELFEGFQGITPSLKKVVFRSPFRPFYYRWKRFGAILDRQRRDDPAAAAYTQLLHDTLSRHFGATFAEIDDLVGHGVITHSLLWALFEPGTLAVAKEDDDERFFLVDGCTESHLGHVGVMVRFIDWDGSRFGYAKAGIHIPPFDGTCEINKLGIYPARFHGSQQKAEAEATLRGRRFYAFGGFHHKAYSGMARVKSRAATPRHVDGRIIVDAASYFHANNAKEELVPLSESLTPRIDVQDDAHNSGNNRTRSSIATTFPRPSPRPVRELRDEDGTQRKQIDVGDGPAQAEERPGSIPALTDTQLLICNTTVKGYSLKLKRWAEFRVADVAEVAFNDAAFPNLMLPGGYKNLILSFVDGQAKPGDNTFDDVIEGKGRGIVMLLTGNPGVGKTLTAEAVADKLRKPLYVLSAGELGEASRGVEQRLREVLELTEKWNGVLLFDECDVFLQERSANALAHNEIVAVFLRLLEYHRGILIMTTNRADSIDRAFQSRIHLTLHYPDLDAAAKEHIWRQFVARSLSISERDDGRGAAAASLADESFACLARLPLNGREIKNIVKVATLLACQEQTVLGMGQIETVLRATRGMGPELDVLVR